ncbi:Uncharacterised protein [Mycobacterium tuberculosis]|nr:Uncharacterised protein [Mycobacterium tuberculosis]
MIPSSTAVGKTLSTGAMEPMMFIAGSSRRWVICARIFFIRATGSIVPTGAARLTPVNWLPPAASPSARRLTGTAIGSVLIGTPRASW